MFGINSLRWVAFIAESRQAGYIKLQHRAVMME
jgi:hypothetical protein